MADALRMRWRMLTASIKQHPKLLYAGFAALPLFLILFDFVAYSYGSLPATSDSIELAGLRRLSPATVRSEILRKLRTANAENLIEVDLTELSEYLLQRLPAIRSAVIAQNIGRGVMTVTVSERTGIANIRTISGIMEVDRDGMLYVTDKGAPGKLPEVTGVAGAVAVPGRNVYEHPSGAGLMRVMSTLSPELSRRLTGIRIVRPDYFELQFAGDILVKADPLSFPHKIDPLKKILLTPRPISYIDVRFQQDVVSYKASAAPNRPGAHRKKAGKPL